MATIHLPADLERHLGYEIDMLNGSYALIANIEAFLTKAGASSFEKEVALNAVKEDFCIHARLLVEFFLKGKDNPASSFASGYSRPSEPGDRLVQKLNNQIAHFMDGRAHAERDKIGDSDREKLLRWIDVELERWRPLRDSTYARAAIPSVDLSLIPTAGGTTAPILPASPPPCCLRSGGRKFENASLPSGFRRPSSSPSYFSTGSMLVIANRRHAAFRRHAPCGDTAALAPIGGPNIKLTRRFPHLDTSCANQTTRSACSARAPHERLEIELGAVVAVPV